LLPASFVSVAFPKEVGRLSHDVGQHSRDINIAHRMHSFQTQIQLLKSHKYNITATYVKPGLDQMLPFCCGRAVKVIKPCAQIELMTICYIKSKLASSQEIEITY
jgi:hypothetical protein